MCSKNKSSDYVFTEGFVETIDFPVPLFLDADFVYRKGKEHVCSFQFHNLISGGKALAHFSILPDHTALSFPHAPFGSIYCNEHCKPEDIRMFIEQLKKKLTDKQVKKIILKHYPACYGIRAHNLVLTEALASGFVISCTELNQYISIVGMDSSELFEASKMHLIKKCKEAGFTVHRSSSFNPELWFDIIKRARKGRGHPMTIDLESLKNINKLAPERYHFFTVNNGEQIVSCAIGVQVTGEVLYYYLAADEEEYRAYSPMTFLLEGLYAFACEQNIQVLDMGISSSQGIINEGLRWFKKSFGSQEQPKFVLECTLNE